MSDTALIAETNRLLERFFAMRQEEKEAAEKFKIEREAWKEKHHSNRDESLREKLKEHGASVEGFDGSMEDWEARMKAVRVRGREESMIETAKEREYKDRMLEEMQSQSELLRRIAEKLGA